MVKSFIYGLAVMAMAAGFVMSNSQPSSLKLGQGTYANFSIHNFLHFNAMGNN